MKKLVITTIALWTLAIGVGIFARASFVNKNSLEEYTVATVNETVLSPVYEDLNLIVEQSYHILRVRCKSEVQFSFKLTYQEVEVLEVFSGDKSVGERINISPSSSCIFSDDDSINLGFVNAMKVGEEYLVFLADEQYSVELEKVIYPTITCNITMIFSYDDIENVVVNKIYVPYEEVKNSEIFARTKEAEELFLKIKGELLEAYPN